MELQEDKIFAGIQRVSHQHSAKRNGQILPLPWWPGIDWEKSQVCVLVEVENHTGSRSDHSRITGWFYCQFEEVPTIAEVSVFISQFSGCVCNPLWVLGRWLASWMSGWVDGRTDCSMQNFNELDKSQKSGHTEDVFENQIKGEWRLWTTLPADTVLQKETERERKKITMFSLVKVRAVFAEAARH